MSKSVNLKDIITFSDLKNGFQRLRNKNKYSVYNVYEGDKRYLKSIDKKGNGLLKFLKVYLNDKDEADEKKLLTFYTKITDYNFDPYVAMAIEKGRGTKKYRPLLVPSPRDRLIFESLLPIYYSKLKESLQKRNLLGLGLVKKQKISDIIKNIYTKYVQNGYTFVLTLDYSSFFSLIDRSTLLKKLSLAELRDYPELVNLLKIIINNDITNGEDVQEITKIPILENGIPQGLSFSPLMACYYALDIDDIYLEDSNVVGYRYIDDIIIFAKSEEYLKELFFKIDEKSQLLKMSLHPLKPGSKTELKDLNTDFIKYLGVEISSKGLNISNEKFDTVVSIIQNEIFTKNSIKNRDVKKIKKVYYDFISGWLNHYENIIEDKNNLYKKLDHLILNNFFSKKNYRIKFYNLNPWIKIENNIELLGKKNISSKEDSRYWLFKK